MRNYEAPKFEIVKLENHDIIQTSTPLNLSGNTTIPGQGIVVPKP